MKGQLGNNTIYSFVIIVAFIQLLGCDIDFSGGELQMPQTETYEYVVGPEGSVIVVNDYSSIHGFTLEIPEGALARTSNITVTKYADAPSLPKGLDNTYNPAIELTSDAPFLKEIQIKFPSIDTPENSGKMLTAFYWDSSKGNWQIVMPESFENDLMTVKTQHFSYWQWGEVILDDVEPETLNPWLDVVFGPEYMDRLAEALESESLKLMDWRNLDYCANQYDIANTLREIKESARIRTEDYLSGVNTACNVWDHTPVIGDIFYGFNEIIEIHTQYLGTTIAAEGISMVPFIGDILSIMAKASAKAVYEQRLGNLRDEYACIFTNADPELWINFGLYISADAALLSMELVEIEHPCN